MQEISRQPDMHCHPDSVSPTVALQQSTTQLVPSFGSWSHIQTSPCRLGPREIMVASPQGQHQIMTCLPDTGSTHDFIVPSLVHQLEMQRFVQPVRQSVLPANQHTVMVDGVVWLQFRIQNDFETYGRWSYLFAGLDYPIVLGRDTICQIGLFGCRCPEAGNNVALRMMSLGKQTRG